MKGRIHLVAGVLTFMMAGLWVAAQSAQIKDFRPITDERLRNPRSGRLAALAPHARRLGVQPAEPDQPAECRPAPARVVVGHAPGVQSGDAARLTTASCISPTRTASCRRSTPPRGTLIWEYRREFPAAQGQARRAVTASAARSETSRSGTTRSTSTPPTRTSSRSTPAPARSCGTRPSPIHSKGYGYTSGPIIVNGKVVSGMTGCTRYKDDICFISAHDARTGKAAVAHVHGRAPGRAGRRHVGRSAADVPGRRRRLDPRQLRPQQRT